MTMQLEFPTRRSFHHGSLETPRLKKLLDYLRLRGTQGATTMDIALACATTRASSDVSEARANGVEIMVIDEGLNENGRRITRFILRSHL